VVGITWAQLLALLFLATLPWIAVGFWLGRLTRTDDRGVERLVFPVDDHVDPHAAQPPRRRYTDQVEP
jgi:hypothetical protein